MNTNKLPRVVSGNLEKIPLTPFHTFISTLKPLHANYILLQCPQTLNLIRSFPLLGDLSLIDRNWSLGDGDGHDPRGSQTIVPPTSPTFTRSLDLRIYGGAGDTVRYLLDLPNGPHFRQIALSWLHKEDLRRIRELVARCADTFECLNVRCYPPCTSVLVPHWSHSLPPSIGDSSLVSVDLPKATKLRDVAFWAGSLTIVWIIVALQTITPEHHDLQQITIHTTYGFSRIYVDDVRGSDAFAVVGPRPPSSPVM